MKAIAIISMVFCHPVLRLGMYRPGYENEFLYFFGDTVLGDYIVVAHGLMFAMGVGIVYSRNNGYSDLVRRGIKIYVLGYILNFLRYGVYTLGYGLISGEFPDETLHAFLCQDILQFAGLALVATGIFKRIGYRETHILFIGLVLSVLGTLAPDIDAGSYVPNMMIGTFIFTTEEASCFCFANWYVFVAVGIIFGKRLQGIADKDAFYKKLLIISGCIAAVYIALTYIWGVCFLSRNHYYYTASPAEAAGFMSIDFFVLSLFHYILKKTGVSKFRFFIEMSLNVTEIYFIHWSILGFIEVVFCYLNEMVFTYPVIYSIGAVLLLVSAVFAELWRRREGCAIRFRNHGDP
jgi:hypothetical protein